METHTICCVPLDMVLMFIVLPNAPPHTHTSLHSLTSGEPHQCVTGAQCSSLKDAGLTVPVTAVLSKLLYTSELGGCRQSPQTPS